jgi:hypothetical protein
MFAQDLSNAMVYVINADKTISYKDGDFTGFNPSRQYIYRYFGSLYNKIIQKI